MFVNTMSLLALAAVAVAAPGPRSLPSGTVTCGRDNYSVSSITAAINAGVSDMKAGNYPDDYPHQFRNDEGLKLWCSGSGPWYEFPIMSNGQIYTSSASHYNSPGADRVIFTSSGTYCAVATHTGASSSDGFVACAND